MYYQNQEDLHMRLKSIAIIVTILALAVCLWGCGEPSADENYVIKAKSGITKTEIGATYNPVISANSDEDGQREIYEEGRIVFNTIKDSDAVFFSLDFDENAIPCFRINTRKTKKGLAKAVGFDDKSDIDYAVKYIGKGVKGFLNQDVEGMQDYDAEGWNKGMFPGGLGKANRVARSSLKWGFDGESPDKYFKKRDLSITCKSIKAKKVAVVDRGALKAFFIIFKAKVHTDSCDGDSVFPSEGKTGTMKIMVGAEYSGNPPIKYFSIYFQ